MPIGCRRRPREGQIRRAARHPRRRSPEPRAPQPGQRGPRHTQVDARTTPSSTSNRDVVVHHHFQGTPSLQANLWAADSRLSSPGQQRTTDRVQGRARAGSAPAIKSCASTTQGWSRRKFCALPSKPPADAIKRPLTVVVHTAVPDVMGLIVVAQPDRHSCPISTLGQLPGRAAYLGVRTWVLSAMQCAGTGWSAKSERNQRPGRSCLFGYPPAEQKSS